MEIKFSTQGTGACPLCHRYGDCRILKKMAEVFQEEASERHDNTVEAVIYRCPEFEEG